MGIKGIVKAIVQNPGRVSFGYISPEVPIVGCEGDIRFFPDKLIGVTLDKLSQGDTVEFNTWLWNKKDGSLEVVAIDVRVRNKAAASSTVVKLEKFNSKPTEISENKSTKPEVKKVDINTLPDTLTGVIYWVIKDEGRGYIKADGANLKQNIIFFKEDLELITIESISKGDKVEFGIAEQKRSDGTLEFVAKRITPFKESVSPSVDITPTVYTPEPLANQEPVDTSISITTTVDKPKHFPKNVVPNAIFDTKQDICSLLDTIANITEPEEFEDNVILLLGLLGINNLYQYDTNNRAGRADGIFILGRLAVIYYCTLKKAFGEHQKDQIENYVNKFRQSQLTIDIRRSDGVASKKTLLLHEKNRQVWIITTDRSRELQNINGISVKEVSVKDLLRIFQEKLYSDIFEEEELSGKLAMIARE